MTFASRLAASALAAFTLATISLATVTMTTSPAAAQQRGREAPDTYRSDELVGAGHRFFGNVSRGLASVIEKAVSQWGLPNGYILGEEGSGAIVAGLRYGEGTLYTKNAGDLRVYWQGPSLGFDWGGDGARTMTLVYNLPATQAIYQRFGGIDGSAYIIGGFGMTALTANNIVLVPIRSGLGLRLGVAQLLLVGRNRDRDQAADAHRDEMTRGRQREQHQHQQRVDDQRDDERNVAAHEIEPAIFFRRGLVRRRKHH